MTGDFGIGDRSGPVAHPDAELRAADAQRPADYRSAVDRAAAGVSLRVVGVVILAIAFIAWLLTSN